MNLSMACAVAATSFALAACNIQTTAGGSAWTSGPTNAVGVAAFDDGVASISLALAESYGGSPMASAGDAGTATGSISTAGTTASITGTFDPASGALSVDGGSYSLSGTADSSGISGTAESPTGPGAFAVMPGTVTALCGSFAGAVSGPFGLVFASGGRAVAVYAADGTRGAIEGTVSAGKVSFAEPIEINGRALTISGTASGGSGQGTWSDSASTSGTWSATSCH